MRILFLLAAYFLCGGMAQADPVRFALNHWPPYGIAENGEEAGIDVDVAREIARRLDFELVIRKCPFKRCLTEMEFGKLDLQSGIARNEERAKYLNYADRPYHQVSVVFHVRRGERDLLRIYEDLRKLRVGAVVKSHYFEPFNSDQSLNKVEVSEEKQLPAMLAAGRIDTYVGTDPNASYDILTRGYKDRLEQAVFSPGVNVPVYFAVSRKSPLMARMAEVNAAINAMHEDGTIERIVSQYR